jgi:hypothetical protein
MHLLHIVFRARVQHIVFRNHFMRVRKKEIEGFVVDKTVYSPNNEYRHCLHIFAAISKEPISIYTLKSCKKQIVGLLPLHFKIKQSIGRELDELLKKFKQIPCSHVLEKCLILEVNERISKWGCKTPQQFIELMNSDEPLRLLVPKKKALPSLGSPDLLTACSQLAA